MTQGVLAVAFRVGGAQYALRCQSVVEVIPRVALRSVPHAPAWLRGVFAYRGGLSPVVDLCSLLGGYECGERLSSRIVLVQWNGLQGHAIVGLLAEHVTETRRVRASALPRTPLGPGAHLGEMVEEDGALLHLIDEAALLRDLGLGAPTSHAMLGDG